MTINAKRNQNNEVVTGDRISRPEAQSLGAEAVVEPAKFVTVLHTRVGHYAQGSIVAASVFEYAKDLIGLGAIEYNYDASEESLTGNQEHANMLLGMQSAMAQTMPIAPWANASAANLLGAKYVALGKANRTWQTVVENATKEIALNPS